MGRIIKTDTTKKDPNGAITRIEAAVELYRMAKRKGYKVPFALGEEVEKAVAWEWAIGNRFLRSEKEILGEEDKEVPMNRAEAAYMFHVFGLYCQKMDQRKGN